jgi:hypothetical protein
MKIASTIIAERDRREQFVWGRLRLFLGFAQMSLAGLALGALIAVGPTKLTNCLRLPRRQSPS